jgi:hypothetical protein
MRLGNRRWIHHAEWLNKCQKEKPEFTQFLTAGKKLKCFVLVFRHCHLQLGRLGGQMLDNAEG